MFITIYNTSRSYVVDFPFECSTIDYRIVYSIINGSTLDTQIKCIVMTSVYENTYRCSFYSTHHILLLLLLLLLLCMLNVIDWTSYTGRLTVDKAIIL